MRKFHPWRSREKSLYPLYYRGQRFLLFHESWVWISGRPIRTCYYARNQKESMDYHVYIKQNKRKSRWKQMEMYDKIVFTEHRIFNSRQLERLICRRQCIKRCTAVNGFGKSIYHRGRKGKVHELGNFAVNTKTGYR